MLKSPSAAAQGLLVKHITDMLQKHRDNKELRSKMAVVDAAYARYTEAKQAACNGEGVDEQVAMQTMQEELEELRDSFIKVTVPILVSQVDTFVSYASEIYLSGYPMFGVVTPPKDKKVGQYIEALVDKHARIGKYTREMQMFFRDCGKYNYGTLMATWDSTTHYQRTSQTDVDVNEKPTLTSVDVGYTALKRTDPYNTFIDSSVLPGDASRDGDYAGTVELLTMSQLRRRLNKLQVMDKGFVINKNVALKSNHPTHKSFEQPPQVSNYIKADREFDWDRYLGAIKDNKNDAHYGSKYEVVTAFCRLEVKDFSLSDVKGEHIYKVMLVNGQHIVYMEHMYTPFEHLPILVGQPLEDGLGLQTQSMAEAAIPMQKATSGLVNMRFHAARRSISDRALYDENMIHADDVNNESAAAKIPVKTNTLTTRKLSEAYYSIPYTDTASNVMLSDALTISDWTSDLNGFNRATQGRFTKGNRTQGEYSDIMSNSEQRQRLPILVLEGQVMQPLKQIIMLNILRFASGEVVQAQDTGEPLEVDINQLTNIVLDFKVADGYLPKAKLANTDLLSAMMAQLGQNQILAASYGDRLPGMFAHLASLGGIAGLEQYTPEQPQNPQTATTPEALNDADEETTATPQ